MRTLVILIVVAALGWSGWWWLGATGHEKAVDLWLEDRRAAGWVAEYSDLTVTGYPNRIDTMITGLDLADPRAGWAWSAPRFEVLSLSYKPNHVIAVWPGTQKYSTRDDTVEITSDRMRGSLTFVPDTGLTLDRLRLEVEAMDLKGQGWSSSLASANAATERITDDSAPQNAHAIGLDIRELTVPADWLALIDPDGVLPRTMDHTHIDVIAAFDAPWDRRAIETGAPMMTDLRLRDVNAKWGELELAAAGRIAIDRAGYFEGDVTLRLTNWEDMVNVAVTSGLIPADFGQTIVRGLKLLAGISGSAKELDVPLRFASGSTFLGPLPIGPAPRLVRR